MNPRNQMNPPRAPNTQNQTQAGSVSEEGIKINGLEQVVEMLRFADPAFRESLLKRIGQRDPNLAAGLRRMFR